MRRVVRVRTFIGKHSVARTAIEQAEQAANAALRTITPEAEAQVIQAQTIIHRGTGPESGGINDMFYHFITVTFTEPEQSLANDSRP